jgi:hypothetical protein
MIKKIIALHFFFIIVVLTFCISPVHAINVSQTIGFRDVGFSSLNKQFCKGCHGDSLVDTHHETSKFEAGACVFCHTVSSHDGTFGVVLQRDCLKCHLESPHHKTEAARNNECTNCHDTAGLSDYSTDGPKYGMSKVTPAVSNCGRCHGEGKDGDTPIIGYKDTHHNIALENCNVCHTDTDPKTVNVRICERCHNVEAIHKVPHHVVPENCVKCHISDK